MAKGSQGVVAEILMDFDTPKNGESAEPTTPRRSERKRALFPTASPQTSDLGHMSPLGSSPDRFSSAPATPDSTTYSPIRKPSAPVSPFGRKASMTRIEQRLSPRKQFSLLLANTVKDKLNCKNTTSKITPIVSNQNNGSRQSFRSTENPNEIVPIDQLEQTVLSVMYESDCSESPHSEYTPDTTPQNKEGLKDSLDKVASQPLTPSKRRSMPVSGSGSVSSTSPHSPEQKRKFSLQSRSRSAGAELPRARTSLFSGSNRSSGAKRPRDDGIYLTGRNTKRRKMYGEINAGVSTGIRRPPKVKSKSNPTTNKKQGKVKSVWDVAPKSSKKRSLLPIKLPKMSLLANAVKKSDEEAASFSASASLHVRAKRAKSKDDIVVSETEENETEMESPEPAPNKRFFKNKSRAATFTVSKNVRIKIHKGKFTVEKPSPAPPAKRRRKLYSLDKQIQAIKAFDDNEEDVAADVRSDVQNILKKLEEDKSNSPEFPLPPKIPSNSVNTISGTEEQTSALEQKKIDSASPNSPTRLSVSTPDTLMSPLSQLASCTSTLSIDVCGDTLHLTQAQVLALSVVPDVIMEDDDTPLCDPLPEEQDLAGTVSELKENCNSIESELTPVKYFPIFDTNFSHQKVPLSPLVAKRKRSLLRPIGNDQYQLDAGQKRFGATECGSCSAIYQMGEPEDEQAHQEFHDAVKDLKFVGWKNECVVGQYGRNRVIVIRPGDHKSWWSKALDVLKVVDKDLGFADGVPCDTGHSMVYFYILDKSIVGCLLAIPVKKANKMLETTAETKGIDCCTAEEYPVKCGVSRIWVHRPFRKQGVARQLMDCLRKTFIFGHVLSLDDIAFSSPTTLGKIFAEHYTGCKDYCVYTQA